MILDYMRKAEKDGLSLTAEDVLNALAPEPDDRRRTLANELQSLIWGRYIEQDLVTGVLKLRESVK